MNIGIRFTIKYDVKVLDILLHKINFKEYNFEISEQEVLSIPDGIYQFPSLIEGTNFNDVIISNSLYILSIIIKAYKKDDTENYIIKNLDDFINSKCQFMILITDAYYVDFYSKDLSLIELIKNNALKFNCNDIEYIDDENDSRTGFCDI